MQAFGDGAGIKTYRRGTHRAVAPEETIARVRPAMARVGITRVANLTGLDRSGVPVVMVCRPNARSSAVFHGKGTDLAAAKASGIMEAIETWHAEHTALPLRFGSVNELRVNHRLVDVARLAREPESHFHPDLPILWIEGRDLVSDEPRWLPFESVHADGTMPTGMAGGFSASTNGLASGNHLSEATSHALCELIERDATSLWHRRDPLAQAATRLDLSTVTDDSCVAILAALRQAAFAVAVWDTTTDVGVPTFQCLLLDPADEVSHVGHGAGCHPAREIALLRAITEAAQVRTTYIIGSREDIEHADYRPATLQSRVRQARLLMRPASRMRDFATVARFVFDSFDTEVEWLIQRLKAVGIEEAVAVDLTRPELGVPVVRIVVPGLEGSDHHAAYVPGARARAIHQGAGL
jgi:YcaO-like protein with predicted kinase domain